MPGTQRQIRRSLFQALERIFPFFLKLEEHTHRHTQSPYHSWWCGMKQHSTQRGSDRSTWPLQSGTSLEELCYDARTHSALTVRTSSCDTCSHWPLRASLTSHNSLGTLHLPLHNKCNPLCQPPAMLACLSLDTVGKHFHWPIILLGLTACH